MKLQLAIVAVLTAIYTTVFVFTGDLWWFVIGGLGSALINLALRAEMDFEERAAKAWARHRRSKKDC
jgi:hypothetical protein